MAAVKLPAYDSPDYDRRRLATLLERCLIGTDPDLVGGPCLLFHGAQDSLGYPVCGYKGGHDKARRVVWRCSGRQLWPGQRIFLGCGKTNCLNVLHMMAVPWRKPGDKGGREIYGMVKPSGGRRRRVESR